MIYIERNVNAGPVKYYRLVKAFKTTEAMHRFIQREGEPYPGLIWRESELKKAGRHFFVGQKWTHEKSIPLEILARY
ncbi:MAG: hypothetical protein EBQ96_10045 [Proteobacteria bacterium]|nr:hypothetical protein [Pseudomonadota bacterium]